MDTAQKSRIRPQEVVATGMVALTAEAYPTAEDTPGQLTTRLFQLFDALEALATLPDVAQLVQKIPPYSAYRVDRHLVQALDNLTHVAQMWTRKQTW